MSTEVCGPDGLNLSGKGDRVVISRFYDSKGLYYQLFSDLYVFFQSSRLIGCSYFI